MLTSFRAVYNSRALCNMWLRLLGAFTWLQVTLCCRLASMRARCHAAEMLSQEGCTLQGVYWITTGCTGTPARKAPVLKGSRQCPLVVVPCLHPPAVRQALHEAGKGCAIAGCTLAWLPRLLLFGRAACSAVRQVSPACTCWHCLEAEADRWSRSVYSMEILTSQH